MQTSNLNITKHIKASLSRGFLLCAFLFFSFKTQAQLKPINGLKHKLRFKQIISKVYDKKSPHRKENKKLVTTALAIPLGFFGVHRLYLGTDPIVPVVYTLTAGGGFYLLTITDIVLVLSAKDLERYENNGNIFLFIEDDKKEEETK